MEEQFPVPRNTAASKIGNGVISLPWQLRCHCNPDHNKFSSLSNTTVVLICPNLCLCRRSLRSNVGGIHCKKLYRATLKWAQYEIFPSGQFHTCLLFDIVDYDVSLAHFSHFSLITEMDESQKLSDLCSKIYEKLLY